MNGYLFTFESVAERHPDKMTDRVSDAILDTVFLQDPWGRVAYECLVKTGATIVAGEISTHTTVSIEKTVRNTIKEIGYDHSRPGSDDNTCCILNIPGKQSASIADGICGHSMEELGVDDQGITFGYACDEASGLMPAMLVYVHRLMERQTQLRKSQRLPFLLPDARSQVTLRYQDNRVHSIDIVVASTQHNPDVSLDVLREAVIEGVVKPVMPSHWSTPQARFLVSPIGSFVISRPVGDCGLTGRKIIVNAYSSATCHGGSVFSGKDSSKVDRSTAYAARYMAKNIVAVRLASHCEVQLGQAIGLPHPVSIRTSTFGTQTVSPEALLRGVNSHFDLSAFGIIITLGLLVPRYRRTTYYGHFSRGSFPWGITDKAALLYENVGRQADDA